jgi:hypothetical protein
LRKSCFHAKDRLLRDGKYHNQVLVDGKSEPENMTGFANGYQAATKYLGAASNDAGGFASADLTESYSYRWLTQPAQSWPEAIARMGCEMDPSDQIARIYAGTARYRMRPWWPTYTFCNYIATCRAPFNPMRYVFRTVGLVRGAHPYGLVVDDLKKDDQPHLYQWTAMLNGGVRQADVAGLGKDQVALAYHKPDSRANGPRALISPAAGEPLLLVCSLDPQASGDGSLPLIQAGTETGPDDRQGKRQTYDRLAINLRATQATFGMLLLPLRYGEPLPRITFDSATGTAQVQYKDQADRISLTTGPDHRTKVTVSRNGKAILEVK